MAISSGYNFYGVFNYDNSSLRFSFLGKNTDGSYGWFATFGEDITYTWDAESETRTITSHIRYMELISPRIL